MDSFLSFRSFLPLLPEPFSTFRASVLSSPFSQCLDSLSYATNAVTANPSILLLMTAILAPVFIWCIMDSDDLEKTSTSSPPSSFWSERSFGKAKALSTWKYRKLASSRRTIFLVVGLLLAIVALALGLGLGLGLQSHQAISTAVHPIVDLGYAQYRGNNSSGVASWLGIRYAATPIGRLRFAAPQPPKPQKGVQSGLHVRV